MCVIAYKPAGKKWFNMEELQNCFLNNADGAGLMYYAKDGQVIIKKGFMSSAFSKLGKAMSDIPDESKEGPVAWHFRIRTHGKVSPEICHPYPICDDYKNMKLVSCSCRSALMHNGIFPLIPENDSVSDTMCFVKNILIPHPNLLTDDGDLLLHLAVGSSRLLVFGPKRKVLTVGKWETERDIMYSNTSYKWVRSPYSNTTGGATTGYSSYGSSYPFKHTAEFISMDSTASCQQCINFRKKYDDEPCRSCDKTIRDNFTPNKSLRDCNTCIRNDAPSTDEVCNACLVSERNGMDVSFNKWAMDRKEWIKTRKAMVEKANANTTATPSATVTKPTETTEKQSELPMVMRPATTNTLGGRNSVCPWCIHMNKTTGEDPCVECYHLPASPRFVRRRQHVEDGAEFQEGYAG